MKEVILFFFLIVIAVIAKAQTLDSSFYFSGYVFDEDSIPIENALIVNYRSLKAYRTNEEGYFSVKVEPSDSLKINHISYIQKVIVSNKNQASTNKYYLPFEAYIVKTVNVKLRDFEMENFNRNIALIKKQLKETTPVYYTKGSVVNTYAPVTNSGFFEVNILQLPRLMKQLLKE
jgi:hypothetical protein